MRLNAVDKESRGTQLRVLCLELLYIRAIYPPLLLKIHLYCSNRVVLLLAVALLLWMSHHPRARMGGTEIFAKRRGLLGLFPLD